MSTQGRIPKDKKSLQGAKITAKTKFDEIMNINPDAGMILFEHGMHCIGCGMASMETLEQGCAAHGIGKKEIEELIKKLNSKKVKEIKMEVRKEVPKISERSNLELRKKKKPSFMQKVRRGLR